MSRHELIERLHDEFDKLIKSVEDLDEEQMTRVWFGDWAVREILAHIAGWHWEMVGVLERIAKGERPVPEGIDYSDADSWNARFAEEARKLDPDEVLDDLRASKEAFVAAALEVPEDRFEEGRAAYRILHTSGIDHYREHYPIIQEWRQREGI